MMRGDPPDFPISFCWFLIVCDFINRDMIGMERNRRESITGPVTEAVRSNSVPGHVVFEALRERNLEPLIGIHGFGRSRQTALQAWWDAQKTLEDAKK